MLALQTGPPVYRKINLAATYLKFKVPVLFKIPYHISNAYQDISILKIISPIWPDFPLSTNIPDVQLETLGLHTFNVKTL